jgi:hypothetical protein
MAAATSNITASNAMLVRLFAPTCLSSVNWFRTWVRECLAVEVAEAILLEAEIHTMTRCVLLHSNAAIEHWLAEVPAGVLATSLDNPGIGRVTGGETLQMLVLAHV